MSESQSGIELAPGVFASEGALRWQYARGSGPGGQNVNKVNTKAELWVKIADLRGLNWGSASRLRTLAGRRLTAGDELHLSSDEHRSQESNRSEVLERLREMLIQAKHEPKRRRKTRPTRSSRERRLTDKRVRSQAKLMRRPNDHGE